MSYSNKANRPDSRDTAKLRAEYEKKAQEFRDTREPASAAKLKDDKAKLFQRVVAQINAERSDALREEHKVLARRGLYRSEEQVKAERERMEAAKEARLRIESRV